MRWLLALLMIISVSVEIFAEETSSKDEKDFSNHDKIMAKMEAVSFEKIELKDATIEEITHLLFSQSKTMDPENQGINFVYEGDPHLFNKVTLTMENTSLRAVLKKLFNAYSVGDSNIHLKTDYSDRVWKRTFPVPSGFFELKPGMLSNGTPIAPKNKMDLRHDYFNAHLNDGRCAKYYHF